MTVTAVGFPEEVPRPRVHDDVQAEKKAALQSFVAQVSQEGPAKPPGYGTLGVSYEWFALQKTGMREQIRARCIPCQEMMVWTMKIDPRYGFTLNGKVEYEGRPVQAWTCKSCKQWVVA